MPSRHVLLAVGLDNRAVLSAASDRFNGFVDVHTLLDQQHKLDQKAGVSVRSLLYKNGYEYGSTYHASSCGEEDKLDEENVYMDIGDDPEEALDAALKERVEHARRNGLSDADAKELQALLN